MREFVVTGHATDGSGMTIDGTLIVRGNEPPKNLTITPSIAEPPAGYNPGVVVEYKLTAQDDVPPIYSMDVTIDGITTALPLKAGTTDTFVFTVPAA